MMSVCKSQPDELVSVKGLLSLLIQQLPQASTSLLSFTLNRLLKSVDTHWYEIATHLDTLETLSYSPAPAVTREIQQQAALLASQVYFHLNEMVDSIEAALHAGPAFAALCTTPSSAFPDPQKSEYTETILGGCIDSYVRYQSRVRVQQQEQLRRRQHDQLHRRSGGSTTSPHSHRKELNPETSLDPRLANIFESIADQWLQQLEAEAAEARNKDPETFVTETTLFDMIGFALRTQRVDILLKALKQAPPGEVRHEALAYATQTAVVHEDRGFRHETLAALAKLFKQALPSDPHHPWVTGESLLSTKAVEDPTEPTSPEIQNIFRFAECLTLLEDAKALAQLITGILEKSSPSKPFGRLVVYQLAVDLAGRANQSLVRAVAERIPQNIDATLFRLLNGEIGSEFQRTFLFRRTRLDPPYQHILRRNLSTRRTILSRPNHMHASSVVLYSYSLLYAGSCRDTFLRSSLRVLSKFTGWDQFAVMATVGAVHAGNVKCALELLRAFLPSLPSTPSTTAVSGNTGNDHRQSGALFALGLIFMGRAHSQSYQPIAQFLLSSLDAHSHSHVLSHGAALGLGLASMGSRSPAHCRALLRLVHAGDSVSSEAGGAGLGLVALGGGLELHHEVVEPLLRVAQQPDQREKTIRGACMGIALALCGCEERADAIAKELLGHEELWVRYGGCLILGCAYAGTGRVDAIEQLLTVCVTEVDDHVRRTSLLMVGLVCLGHLQRAIRVLRTFVDSYNPHVRYGATLGLGMAGVGTGDEATGKLLWELKDDTKDFVRQGAYLALAFLFMQVNEVRNPLVTKFRQLLQTKASDYRCDLATHFGAILAWGLVDSGGRNCTVGRQVSTGHQQGSSLDRSRILADTNTVVGFLFFSQYWYWYPYIHLFLVALRPTMIVCLNEHLFAPQLLYLLSSEPVTTYTLTTGDKSEQVRPQQQQQEKQQLTVANTTNQQAKATTSAPPSPSGTINVLTPRKSLPNSQATNSHFLRSRRRLLQRRRRLTQGNGSFPVHQSPIQPLPTQNQGEEPSPPTTTRVTTKRIHPLPSSKRSQKTVAVLEPHVEQSPILMRAPAKGREEDVYTSPIFTTPTTAEQHSDTEQDPERRLDIMKEAITPQPLYRVRNVTRVHPNQLPTLSFIRNELNYNPVRREPRMGLCFMANPVNPSWANVQARRQKEKLQPVQQPGPRRRGGYLYETPNLYSVPMPEPFSFQ